MVQVVPSQVPVDIRLPTIGRDAMNLEESLPSQNGGDDFSSDEDFDSDSDEDDSLAERRKEVLMLPSCRPICLLHGVMHNGLTKQNLPGSSAQYHNVLSCTSPCVQLLLHTSKGIRD